MALDCYGFAPFSCFPDCLVMCFLYLVMSFYIIPCVFFIYLVMSFYVIPCVMFYTLRTIYMFFVVKISSRKKNKMLKIFLYNGQFYCNGVRMLATTLCLSAAFSRVKVPAFCSRSTIFACKSRI